MPSVDVIRNITIKGKADGVDDATAALNRLTESIRAANDNLAKSGAVAQDNSASWRLTGEGALSAANHLRQAAEAAYLFSPAFRGVVNEMAVPVLKGAGTALEAVAAGLVVATNYAGTGLIAIAAAAERASPSLAGMSAGVRSAGVAMEAFSPTVTGAAASIGSIALRALPVVGQILLVYDAFKILGSIVTATGERLAEMIEVAEKAQSAGLSAEMFQSFISGAKGAQDQIASFEAALIHAFQATKPILNPDWSVWDTGITKINAVEKAIKETRELFTTDQNFSGAAFFGATQDQDTKIRAVVTYMLQLKDIGQEVAALDIGEKMFGSKFVDDVRTGKTSLEDMKKILDEGSKTTFISNENAKNAKELNDRLQDAYYTLHEQFKPSVDDIAAASLKVKGIWVDIVEAIADAAKNSKVFDDAVNGESAFLNSLKLKSSAPIDESAGLNLDARADNGFGGGSVPFPRRRPQDAPPPPKVDASAYDRATESVLKYIEVTKAASLSVSDAAAAQEKFRVIAQLTAAGMKDGLTPEAAKLKAEMSGLGDKAGAAADALAKARAVSNIDFGRKTAFLSQEDVQIATQLKGIYGNDIPAALNSTYAAGIRVNNAMKDIANSIETNLTTGLTDIATGAQKAGAAFTNMGLAIVKAIEQMIIKITIVQPLMNALQSSIGGGGILGFLGLGGGNSIAAGGVVPGALGPTSVGGAALVAHTGGIVGGDALSSRYVHPAYFDDAPKFHTGGIAGDEVPIIAKRGEGVFTQGQMAAMGGGGQQTTIHYSPNIDARGADSAAVAHLATVLAQDHKNFERNVKGILAKTRQNNPGS